MLLFANDERVEELQVATERHFPAFCILDDYDFMRIIVLTSLITTIFKIKDVFCFGIN